MTAALLALWLAGADPAAVLAEAQAHLQAGEYDEAARLAGPLARDPATPRAERAEAYRTYGLALFHLGLRDEAEVALFEYLKLEPDAHLDPALNAPAAVVFFEDVRARHAGELAKLRPRRVARKKYAALNLLPPWGQFQNEQPVKGWAVGVAELLLLATNITTWALLRDMCDAEDGTCGDSPDTARALRTVNLVSGALFVGVALYGVVDGYVVFRRQRREEQIRFGVAPANDGAMIALSIDW